MKKLFLGLSAIAMLFATSCQNEEDFGASVGETATVAFKVDAPEIQTRADYSDGTTATVLQYAVYDAEGNILDDLTVTDATINGEATVNLQLTTGNTYSVIFWAAAPGAPYSVDFAAKQMTVDYTNAVSNDENRDAFYKHHTFTVKGAQTETIELRRPFAQLNVGTNDYVASENAGYLPTQSAVTVRNIYNTLNLVDGTVENEVEVAFAAADIDRTEEFPVAGYEYLAMNYLLVAADKALVDVDFIYTNGTDAKTRTVGSVPVQRNHRTNLYGQLLTSNVEINVEIKPGYDEPAYTADALYQAAAFGGEVTLTENLELTTPLDIQANMTINLNGYSITGAFEKDGVNGIINNANTLIITNGTIKNTTVNGGAVINNSGNLILKGVKIEGAPIADGGYPAYAVITSGKLTVEEGTEIISDRGAINLQNGADVTINGGNCTVTDALGTRALTAHVIYAYGADSKLTINGGNFTMDYEAAGGTGASVICPAGATINVYDGNFTFAGTKGNQSGIFQNYMGYGAPVDVYGGVYNDNTVTKSGNLAAGYKAIEKNGLYYVVAEEMDAVAENLTDLKEALTAGNDVVLAGNVDVAKSEAGDNGYGAIGINQNNGGVIDGNGNSVSVNAWGTWDSAINTTGGTIKNVKVTGGMRGIFVNHNSTNCSKVILENVIIDGTVYTISCDQGTNNGLEAYNSTFNGWTSYAATIGDVKFVNCSFGEGQGYKYCRPYAATKFVNCDFCEGYTVDAVAAVTFENCTLNGVAITDANVATLAANTANVTVK